MADALPAEGGLIPGHNLVNYGFRSPLGCAPPGRGGGFSLRSEGFLEYF